MTFRSVRAPDFSAVLRALGQRGELTTSDILHRLSDHNISTTRALLADMRSRRLVRCQSVQGLLLWRCA